MKYYILHTTTWMSLTNNILSERTQTIQFYLHKISKMTKLFNGVRNQNMILFEGRRVVNKWAQRGLF